MQAKPSNQQDTEYPGVCYSVSNDSSNIFEYNTLRENVNKLKIIQLGINEDSKLLLESSGLNFSNHTDSGINPTRFSELLTMSGLVLNNKIRWISFHGDYDFAYLIKLLTGSNLPESKEEFDKIREIFFPHVFDVKYIFHTFNTMSVGLNKIADQLKVGEGK